jgi:beta-glucanase (GH16 family)
MSSMDADRRAVTAPDSRRTWSRRASIVLVATLAVGLGVMTATSTNAATTDRPPLHAAAEPRKGPRIFTQDFKGSRLNTARWSPCYWWSRRGCTNLSNNELQWYLPGQVKLANGALRLEAVPFPVIGINGMHFPYISGLVSSQSPDRTLFAFTYGYVEARFRVAAGAGLWSALWMLPITRESVPEIDIFETFGERPNVLQMHVHHDLPDKPPGIRGKSFTGPNFSRGWHTVGLEWTPDSLTWWVNGVQRWRITHTKHIPDEPMYLLANLAVGGTHTVAPPPGSTFPKALRFDYIRVWGRPTT